MPKNHEHISKKFQRELTRRMGGDVKVKAVPAKNELTDVYIQVSFTQKFCIDRNIMFDKTTDGLAKGMMNFMVERIRQSAMAVKNMYQLRESDTICHNWKKND